MYAKTNTLRYKKRGLNKSGGHFQFLTHAHIVDRFFITENFLFCNQPEKKDNRKAMFHGGISSHGRKNEEM